MSGFLQQAVATAPFSSDFLVPKIHLLQEVLPANEKDSVRESNLLMENLHCISVHDI